MDRLRIAHVSDLHFGASGQKETWDAFSKHLREEVRPDLVLVTGDIVDTPRRELFTAAKDALDRLCESIVGKSGVGYYVCPGNHDRFPRGNRLTFLKAFGRIGQQIERARSDFNLAFQGHIPSLTAPIRVDLGPAQNRWSLRLLGLDSSLDADFSARGYIALKDIGGLNNAMAAADDIDLAIALVHHHLMPIRSLETARANRLRDIANLTSLVNAGSLVEGFAAAHVDVALHGHEHAANWGRYATFEAAGGETNIIAAGSATGTVTLEQCDISKASYNLIELSEDRKVRLRVRRYDSGHWIDGRTFDIYDSQGLRRVRFMRRTHGKLFRAPNSDVTKYIEFTRERDGLIREIRTQIDFSEQRTLTITPWNSTGIPTDLAIRLADDEGKTWQPEGNLSFTETSQPGEFYFQCEIPEAVAKIPQRVE
jgi:3',5'-cyclic AMP phosphodiesterase CpdA